MHIRRLVLENFGLFRGRTEIDLSSRQRYRKTRPVILIGGTNGAGKTTILEAIRLCLYGSLALGERVSQDEYHSYLRSCVHRDNGMVVPLQSAAVELEFEFGMAGRLQQFHVERSWECNGRSVVTNLTVTKNGAPLDELERAHADEFLRDLIPRGVSQLFFFDGEKIQEMAQASDNDAALAEAIKELLGLDLVSRLRNDLSIHCNRHRESKSPKAIQNELRNIDEKFQQLQQKRLTLVRNHDQCQSKVDRIKEEIAIVNQKLSRTGGSYASERDALKSEQAQLKHSIDDIERQIREACSDLLPFTLSAPLCIALRDQLVAEKTLQDWNAHQKLLHDQVDEAKQTLESTLFPSDDAKQLGTKARQQIIVRAKGMLDGLLAPPRDLPTIPIVHRLSAEDHNSILGAIQRIESDVPKHVKSLEASLEKVSRRLLQVVSALEKIPDDEVLEPIHKKLGELNRKFGKSEAAADRAEEEAGSLDHELEILKRLRDKKLEEIETTVQNSRREELVGRIQTVLDEYATALTKSKIADLSNAVADCFGQLWRKGDVLHQIKIDPETCCVVLLGKQGQVIPKERLSAGERQIYAISILWALARVSGRVLPMVIDTPLARLDSKHRCHLVTRYFPHVSHQVIILSTDTEIDQTYFRELGPAISHTYHLRYDDSDGRTVVDEGYFWGRREAEVTA